jgi:tetratricopeptide (TPR) repeat protein
MSDRLKVLGLFALALLLYGFDLGRGLYFDDPVYITDNALLRRDDALRVFWFSTEAFNYYPVFWSLLRAQWLLWGDAPAGYHAVNLLVHAVNAVLVWRIARAWRLPGAWWIAALFAVHPVQVQTLAWAAEQKNTWSFLFMALAILAFIAHERQGGWGRYAVSLLCFAAALGCKTSVVALPVFLALCYGRAMLFRLAPFFALGAVAGLTTLWFERHRVGLHSFVETLDFWQRSEAAAAALWFYAGKAMLPVGLTPFYAGWVDVTAAAHTMAPLALLLAVAVGCARLRRRLGAPIVLGLAYYALLLSPLLGVFDGSYFVFSRIADHWQYHALPGLLVAVVAALHRWPRLHPLAPVAVAGCAALSSAHLAHFQDARSLWTHAVARNPDAWIAAYNLGNLHAEAREHAEAIAAYREALRARPGYYRAAFNLANTLGAAGRWEEAERAWLAAREIAPDDPDAAVNRAVALLHLGREEEAVAGFQRALALEPGKKSALANLARLQK